MKPKGQGSKKCCESQSEQDSSSNPMMMGMGKMKKMMGPMGSQKEGEADNPMQNMMGMCAEMLTAMDKTTSMAAFATPELHTLFGEWMKSLEREALTAMADKGQMDVATLATALKISEESAIHLIAHLASKGKAVLSIRASGDK